MECNALAASHLTDDRATKEPRGVTDKMPLRCC